MNRTSEWRAGRGKRTGKTRTDNDYDELIGSEPNPRWK